MQCANASIMSAAIKSMMSVCLQLAVSETHLQLAASCWNWLTGAAFTCASVHEVLDMHAASAPDRSMRLLLHAIHAVLECWFGKWHGLREGGRLVLSWAWPMVKCIDRHSTGAAAEGPLGLQA